MPMESIEQPAKGIFGMSKYIGLLRIWWVETVHTVYMY